MNKADFLAGLKHTLPVYLFFVAGNLGYAYFVHGRITDDAVHTIISLSVVAGLMLPVAMLMHWRIRLRDKEKK